MKVIGLTGGIASGKSTASEILKNNGVTIIDADIIAREIVKPNEPALKEIIKEFGDDIVDESGNLKRNLLARIVFNDKEKLEILNKITHKRIVERVSSIIDEARIQNLEKVLVFDAALLIELKLNKKVDEVWLVVVDLNTQIQRLIYREGMTKEDALKIIDKQMSLEEKRKFADVLIDNSGTIENMSKQIINHLKRVMEE